MTLNLLKLILLNGNKFSSKVIIEIFSISN